MLTLLRKEKVSPEATDTVVPSLQGGCMVLIMLIRRSCVIAKVPRYASISICFFKRTPHNHTTKALPCRNATHPSPFGNTFPSRARSSSKPHNLALLVGTTSHSSGNRNLEPDTFSSRARSTPFHCFANGRPHNLALLAEPFIKPNE